MEGKERNQIVYGDAQKEVSLVDNVVKGKELFDYNDLYTVYQLCVDYLNSDVEYSSHFIIELAEEVLSRYVVFSSLRDVCVFHLNNWNECTLQEQCDESEIIVEKICGELGVYFEF